MDFLKKYPHIKLVEDKDTAETAKNQEKQLKGLQQSPVKQLH
jgi:prephenate dehydratase